MSHAAWRVALASCLLAACDDSTLRAFEPHAPAPALGGAGSSGANAEGGGGRAGTTSSEPPAGMGGTGPSLPLLVDDFEDGDPRAEEPLGWWYPINDGHGAQGFGIEPASRGATSVYSLRTHGSGFDEWGAAIGVNLVGDSSPLSLPSYAKLCFVARVEPDASTSIQAHLLRNKEPHYTQEVTLSESWSRYCLPLVGFVRSDGAELVPSEIIALQFFFPPQAPFVLWLDDVQFEP